MTWADFYLICFAVGFAFSFLTFILGGVHWHFPHGLLSGHLHVGTNLHVGHGHGCTPVQGAGNRTPHIHVLNPATIAAFLAWFGGAGFLLSRYSSLRVGIELGLSTIAGLIGAAVIFFFLTRVLISENENLNPADFRMVGVLGNICSQIREGGTGEIMYSQAGTRRVCGARSEDSRAIAKGTEVVVTRYEKGIAYVKLWSELEGEQ